MLVVATPAALPLVPGRSLQVEFQPVQLADGVKPVPWLVERKTELVVERDRAFEVIDEELRREGRHPRRDRDLVIETSFLLTNSRAPEMTAGC